MSLHEPIAGFSFQHEEIGRSAGYVSIVTDGSSARHILTDMPLLVDSDIVYCTIRGLLRANCDGAARSV